MKKFVIIILILLLGAIGISKKQKETHDEWHTFGGKEIVCRFQGCEQRPLYSDWADRFCSDYIDKSDIIREIKSQPERKELIKSLH